MRVLSLHSTKRKGRQSIVAPETARRFVVKNFSLSCFHFLCFDLLADAKTGEVQFHLTVLPRVLFFLKKIIIMTSLGLFLIRTVIRHLCRRDGPLSFCRHLAVLLNRMNHESLSSLFYSFSMVGSFQITSWYWIWLFACNDTVTLLFKVIAAMLRWNQVLKNSKSCHLQDLFSITLLQFQSAVLFSSVQSCAIECSCETRIVFRLEPRLWAQFSSDNRLTDHYNLIFAFNVSDISFVIFVNSARTLF